MPYIGINLEGWMEWQHQCHASFLPQHDYYVTKSFMKTKL